jgi:hypothetical protein
MIFSLILLIFSGFLFPLYIHTVFHAHLTLIVTCFALLLDPEDKGSIFRRNIYQSTWWHIPGNIYLCSLHRENLKSQNLFSSMSTRRHHWKHSI